MVIFNSYVSLPEGNTYHKKWPHNGHMKCCIYQYFPMSPVPTSSNVPHENRDTSGTTRWLKKKWGITLLRCPMAVEDGVFSRPTIWWPMHNGICIYIYLHIIYIIFKDIKGYRTDIMYMGLSQIGDSPQFWSRLWIQLPSQSLSWLPTTWIMWIQDKTLLAALEMPGRTWTHGLPQPMEPGNHLVKLVLVAASKNYGIELCLGPVGMMCWQTFFDRQMDISLIQRKNWEKWRQGTGRGVAKEMVTTLIFRCVECAFRQLWLKCERKLLHILHFMFIGT